MYFSDAEAISLLFAPALDKGIFMKQFKGKRFVIALVFLLAVCMAAPAFAKNAGSGKTQSSSRSVSRKLSFTESKIIMVTRRTKKLTLNRSLSRVRYSSSNRSVVSVDRNGYVTSKKAGKAVITARHGKVSCKTTIIVLKPDDTHDGRQQQRLLAYRNLKRDGRKRVVFAGSSFFDRWVNMDKDFPQYQIINSSVGQSKAYEWIRWAPESIISYKPDAVVLITGSNDIGNGDRATAEIAAARISTLLDELNESLPDTPVFFVSIFQPPARKAAWGMEKKCNAIVKEYCSRTKNNFYIDVAPYMKGSSYYISDKLHPSLKGYKVLRKYITAYLKKYIGQ